MNHSAARTDGEGGFALISALGALVLFSLFAFALLAADRGATAGVAAEIQRARLEAGADAALATVIEQLGAPGARRWPLDGRPRPVDVDGLDVVAVVEDERGKAPLNKIDQDQVRRLLQAAGVSGARLDQLTDSFLEWRDGAVGPNAPKPIDYAAQGRQPRHGPFRTRQELLAIRGMDPAVFDRIAPFVTVYFGAEGLFDADTASPLAAAVMSSSTAAITPDAILRARRAAGQRAAFDPAASASYVGRPFTVRLTVRDGLDGRLQRDSLVELTGQASHPVWTRTID